MAMNGVTVPTSGAAVHPHLRPVGRRQSTLACSAPDAIVLPGEDGTDRINVARFLRPESWGDILDTLNGFEGVLFADVCLLVHSMLKAQRNLEGATRQSDYVWKWTSCSCTRMR